MAEPKRLALGGAVAAIGLSNAVVLAAAAGRVHDVSDAPAAPVAMVLGAQIRSGAPMRMLAARLRTTVDLVRAGRAQMVLMSGDAGGRSGDEIAAMRRYLLDAGIEPERLLSDPLGLCTFDSCRRAVEEFGVRRALVVSQEFHARRAVALSRRVGLDASGVIARADCRRITLARNLGREWLLARPKAVVDMAGPVSRATAR